MRILILIVSTLLSQYALAHGGHHEQIKIKASSTSVKIETHINANALTRFDINGDNKLNYREFKTQYQQIKIWLQQQVVLLREDDSQVAPTLFDIPVSHGEREQENGLIEQIKLIKHFPRGDAQSLRLKLELVDQQGKQVVVYQEGKVFKSYAGKEAVVMTVI